MYAKARKKIHIELPEKIHQKLRVKAALENLSIQKLVEHLISEAVHQVEVGEKQLNESKG